MSNTGKWVLSSIQAMSISAALMILQNLGSTKSPIVLILFTIATSAAIRGTNWAVEQLTKG